MAAGSGDLADLQESAGLPPATARESGQAEQRQPRRGGDDRDLVDVEREVLVHSRQGRGDGHAELEASDVAEDAVVVAVFEADELRAARVDSEGDLGPDTR